MKEGHYEAARDAFLEAYKLFAHPSILLNLGIARAHTGEYVDAEQDLSRFLSDDGHASSDEISSARTALADVRTHLGTVRIKATAEGARAQLDAKSIALAPGDFTDVRTTVGDHALHVEADGKDPWDETLHVTSRVPIVRDVALRSPKDKAPPLLVAPAAEDNGRSRRRVAVSFAGASLIALGIGTFSGLRARALASEYNTERPQDPSARSAGLTYRTVADISFLVSLASAGVGAYLYVVRPAASPSPAVVVGPLFSGVRGTF
ncbi:MAG: hypothetical protein ABIP39_01555 [Polyangiaceae bacterium]